MQVCWDGLEDFQSLNSFLPKPTSNYPGLGKAVVHGSQTLKKGCELQRSKTE